MKIYYVYQILAAGLLWAVTASADIVWSGSMYQRTYHDVAAIDFNHDGTDDFTFNLEVSTLAETYYYSVEPANGQIVVEEISEIWRGGGLAAGSRNRNFREC
jgi:hypothetical protein